MATSTAAGELAAAPDDREALIETMTTARYPEGVWSHGYRECPEADDETVVDAIIAAGFGRHPEQVKPSRGAMVELVVRHHQYGPERVADAVLALLPGRTEAEVLQEAAEWIEGVDLDGQEHAAARLLNERAGRVVRGES